MAAKKTTKSKTQPKAPKSAPDKSKKATTSQVMDEKALTEATGLENEQVAVSEPFSSQTQRDDNASGQEASTGKATIDLTTDLPAGDSEAGSAAQRQVTEAKDTPGAIEKTQPDAPRLPGGITPRPLYAGNPYLPQPATVVEIIEETANIRTLRVILDDNQAMADFKFQPGQVGQLSVFGAGEATFVINSPPSQKGYLQFSVMKAGEVTEAIHKLNLGDKVGVRAPLGNFFPYESWKGKNIFFVGGGIGMAPIRTIMLHVLENKADYGKISLLYGARSPKDMAYSYELDEWKNNPDLDCTLCIDNPYENWAHKVGLIPHVLEEINPSPQNSVAVLCGPPIMIKFTLQTLQKLGFEPENIVTTLEKRMKCGIGICGRCNIGDHFVCMDGPVFTMKQLDGLPQDY